MFSLSLFLKGQEEPTKWVRIDNLPVHKKCAKLKTKPEKQECTLEKLKLYIEKYTIYPGDSLTANYEGSINVKFIIGEDGSIVKEETEVLVGFTGKYAELYHKEALRVINSIPPLIPASSGTKFHRVQYTLPVNFKRK